MLLNLFSFKGISIVGPRQLTADTCSAQLGCTAGPAPIYANSQKWPKIKKKFKKIDLSQ